MLFIASTDNQPKTTQKFNQPVEFVFFDDKKKQEFINFKEGNDKIRDILKDIENKGWQANGVGKPEVLKLVFNGHKGCISRRINLKDRLVYKPLEQGKILILAWKGHYLE